MKTRDEHTTRLLCASVLLNRGGARELVLSWMRDTNRAVALELGLDLALVLKVARWSREQNDKLWRNYLGVGFCTALLAATRAPWIITSLVLLAAAILWFRERLRMHEQLLLFTQGEFDPVRIASVFEGSLTKRELEGVPDPAQNLFVYTGFNPFVGVGHDLGGWSVAISLDRPAKSRFQVTAVEPVDLADLYAAVDCAVESLGISELEPQQCFFVRGTDIRDQAQILPDELGRPAQTFEIATAKQWDEQRVRQYRCYRVLEWNAELAFSYYLRCSLQGKALFVETKRFILTPLADIYRFVDSLRPLTNTDRFAFVASAPFYGAIHALSSPLWLMLRAGKAGLETWDFARRAREKRIRENPRYDYGVANSLRGSLSSGAYAHYFQKLDGDFYNKLLDRTVLDGIVDLLDERGIDTSSLREQQTAILNSGVIVQQGNVVATNLAVGTNSQVSNKITKSMTLRKHSTEKAAE